MSSHYFGVALTAAQSQPVGVGVGYCGAHDACATYPDIRLRTAPRCPSAIPYGGIDAISVPRLAEVATQSNPSLARYDRGTGQLARSGGPAEPLCNAPRTRISEAVTGSMMSLRSRGCLQAILRRVGAPAGGFAQHRHGLNELQPTNYDGDDHGIRAGGGGGARCSATTNNNGISRTPTPLVTIMYPLLTGTLHFLSFLSFLPSNNIIQWEYPCAVAPEYSIPPQIFLPPAQLPAASHSTRITPESRLRLT